MHNSAELSERYACLVLAEARGRLVASDEKRRFHRQANSETYTLLFDGVFFEGKGDEGTLAFWPLPAPPDDEVGLVLARIAARVQRLLDRPLLLEHLPVEEAQGAHRLVEGGPGDVAIAGQIQLVL
jgi:hypothetical protein